MKWEEAKKIVINLQDEHLAENAKRLDEIRAKIKEIGSLLKKYELELLDLEKNKRQWNHMKHEILIMKDFKPAHHHHD